MSWTSAVAIYFVLWWIVLFAVLPWGVRAQTEGAGEGDVVPGSDPGAPAVPALGRKLVATTLISAVIFAISTWLYVARIVTLDDLATLWGLLD